MKYVLSTLAILVAVVCFAVTGPDVRARSVGYSGPAGCGTPDLAEEYSYGTGCGVAANCGAERSIVGSGRWYPGKFLAKGLHAAGRVVLFPVQVAREARFLPQEPRRFRGRHGCG